MSQEGSALSSVSVESANSTQASSIPASFGESIYSKKNLEKVPESFGTPINRDYNASKDVSSKTLEKSAISQDGEDIGTLLTSENKRGMDYDEITGEFCKAGESIEDYAFEFHPDTKLDTRLLDSFKKFALDNQMSVASAQKVAEFYDNHMQKAGDYVKAQQRQWREECSLDSEIGGARFHENMRHAKAGMRRFDEDGKLSKVLAETGFGSHPEVVRFMIRVGKSMGEKSMPKGQSSRKLSTAEMLYPSMRGGR